MGVVLRIVMCVAAVGFAGASLGRPSLRAAPAADSDQAKPKGKPPRVSVWTQFEMNRKDAAGRYLWTTPENWTKGLPGSDLCVEIADDHSGKALHCVIPAGCEANLRVGDVEFWGNKFNDAVNTKTSQRVGRGLAVLKLAGNGVSTIHAREVSFVDAVVLDVRSLKVPAGTYKVIDGTSIKETSLRFAEGTDSARWSFRLDQSQGDLILDFRP